MRLPGSFVLSPPMDHCSNVSLARCRKTLRICTGDPAAASPWQHVFASLAAAHRPSWSASIVFSQSENARRNSARESPASAREIVVSQGGLSRLNPRGRCSSSQCAVAQRTTTAISVMRASNPRNTSATIPENGWRTPLALRGSVTCENTSAKRSSAVTTEQSSVKSSSQPDRFNTISHSYVLNPASVLENLLCSSPDR